MSHPTHGWTIDPSLSLETLRQVVADIDDCFTLINAPYDWARLARPSQRIPAGDWRVWLVMAGRGFGKTRMGAETVRQWVADGYRRIALIGDTLDDIRSVMIEGISGLLNVGHPDLRPIFQKSKGQLLWPNGATAKIFSAMRYEKLRGPQFDAAWVDELAKFAKAQDVWDQLMMSLRLGKLPRVVVTTTPRPTPLIRRLLVEEGVVVTRGHSFENAAHLAPSFLENLKNHYANTRLGAQEIYAQVLDETQGALWSRATLRYQLPAGAAAHPWQRIVVGVDPAVTHTDSSDETGIVVVGLGEDNCGYVLEDLSLRAAPAEWAACVTSAYHRWQADRVVAEKNKGGDLVESVLRVHDPTLSYRGVTATRGKVTRAEPVAALYDQGRVFHAHPFEALEKQMTEFMPGPMKKSPDRVDALVWALTELMLHDRKTVAEEPRVWMV